MADDVSEPLAPESLAREYTSALREYVGGAGEAALTRAYELGRRAAGAGLGLLDVAAVHHEALLRLPPASGGGRSPLEMAAQFLAESLSPFEMALRSYQANARLLGLSETLAQQNTEIDRAREQLRTILDATTAIIYLKDGDGRYVFVNRRFQEVFGVGRDKVIGRRDDEALPTDVARTLQGDDAQVLAARAPHEIEEIFPAADGPHTYLALKFPLLDPAGGSHGVCCVATDITDRKRAADALLRAREAAARERELKRALEAQDRFFYLASHELKTPLTSLELQVASMQRLGRSSPDVTISDEKVTAKCEFMMKQVARLTTLINELIHIGRMSSGDLELSREPVDLAEVVRDVVGGAQDAIRRSGSELVVRAPAAVVGRWDRRQVEGVVAHLLSNAVKFGEGKPIEIELEAASGRAVLTVRDRGIGISDEDRQRIFDRFERAVSERHFGGFGVGLWLARRAVEAHGGEIRARSRPGGGSEFTAELPIDAP